ncbi:hypothetical protein EOPP23_14510 [Endozoicomonas sp. OPT23]|nr:MFS transporter [Endozoicomonas sp. OPT23]MRI34203.1 hypothetical protein [Endozoicomonas sp. OPT23]
MVQGVLASGVATLFCIYQFMMQGAPSVMVFQLSKDLNLSLTQVGFMGSAFLYALFFCQVPGGVLADRSHPGKLLAAGCLLMSLAIYWFSHSENYWETLISRAVMGIATSPAIVVCLSLVARWFPKKLFPFLSGLIESAAMLGGALGPMLLPGLIEQSGWRDTMLFVAITGVCLSGLLLICVRNPTANVSHQDLSEPYQWQQLLNNPSLWFCCIYGLGLFALISGFAGLWGIPFLESRFHDQLGHSKHAVSLIYLGAAVGAPTLGLLASLTGRAVLIMQVCAVLVIIGSSYIFYSDCDSATMCIYCFGTGFISGSYLLVFSEVRKLVPDSMEGVAMAMANAFMLLGAPIIQPLVGWLLELSKDVELSASSYSSALIVIILCQLIAFACICLYGYRLRKEQ